MKTLFSTTSPKYDLNVPDWLKIALLAILAFALTTLVEGTANQYALTHPESAAAAIAITAWILDLIRRYLGTPSATRR